MDNFAIKYYSNEDPMYLLKALQDEYVTSVDWNGNHFCGLCLDWNYSQHYVDNTMPNYIYNLLKN